MKKLTSALMVFLFTATSSASIFDNTIFDRRSPVEKCQSFVADTYGGYSDLLSSCSSIKTDQAAKCVKMLTDVRAEASTAKIKMCGYVNTDEGVAAMRAVIEAQGGNMIENLVAVSFSDTKAESECVQGLIKRTGYAMAKDIVACNVDTTFATLKRLHV